ncbi:protein of unknown function [Shewanella benthica]|uniref:Uncharacterized protein n=1 Tax=Shewanella benthica TaxID=43661 RepID=A0A330M0Y9_9GAMM|nr:protein of unknown function [Shewanella benthica]
MNAYPRCHPAAERTLPLRNEVSPRSIRADTAYSKRRNFTPMCPLRGLRE